MTQVMRAAAIEKFGTADALQIRNLARPSAKSGEVVVRVLFAGVQLTDAAVRAGWTPPGAQIKFPQVLGNEFSGVIEEVGAGVVEFQVGDEVAGFNLLGCYAEYVSVPRSQIAAKPANVAWQEAGALSASGQTAHTAFEELGVKAGEVVVVFGAAGGVGTVFTQLAVRAGAIVIGTASDANHDYVQSMGATAVTYGDGQLDRIRAVTTQTDVVFDAAGHENLRTAVQLTNDRNRIGTIVDMALAVDLGCRVLRSQRDKRRLTDLMCLVEAGELIVHVRRIYQLEEAADAHRDVETGHGRGKVVLQIGQAG